MRPSSIGLNDAEFSSFPSLFCSSAALTLTPDVQHLALIPK